MTYVFDGYEDSANWKETMVSLVGGIDVSISLLLHFCPLSASLSVMYF